MITWTAFICALIAYFWRTYQCSKQREEIDELRAETRGLIESFEADTKTIEDLQREVAAVRAALEDGANERERLKDELENMKLERDEWQQAYNEVERRSAEWQGKYQRLESAMKSALGIRS
jgi:chromosome segregation ATPase